MLSCQTLLVYHLTPVLSVSVAQIDLYNACEWTVHVCITSCSKLDLSYVNVTSIWPWSGCHNRSISSRSSWCLWNWISDCWYGAAFCNVEPHVLSDHLYFMAWNENLEWFTLESFSLMNSMCMICLSLSEMSVSSHELTVKWIWYYHFPIHFLTVHTWVNVPEVNLHRCDIPDPSVVLCQYFWLSFHSTKLVLIVLTCNQL